MTASHQTLQYETPDAKIVHFAVARSWDDYLVAPKGVNKADFLKSIAQALGSAKNQLNWRMGDDICIAGMINTDNHSYQVLAVNLRELFLKPDDPKASIHVVEVAPAQFERVQESKRAVEPLLLEKFNNINHLIPPKMNTLLLSQAENIFSVNLDHTREILDKLQSIIKQSDQQIFRISQLPSERKLDDERVSISIRAKKLYADLTHQYEQNTLLLMNSYQSYIKSLLGENNATTAVQSLLILLRNEALKIINTSQASKSIEEFNRVFNPEGHKLAPLKQVNNQWRIQAGDRDITTGVTDINELNSLINKLLLSPAFKKLQETLSQSKWNKIVVKGTAGFAFDANKHHDIIKANYPVKNQLLTTEINENDLASLSSRVTLLINEVNFVRSQSSIQKMINKLNDQLNALATAYPRQQFPFSLAEDDEKMIVDIDRRLDENIDDQRTALTTLIDDYKKKLQLQEEKHSEFHTSDDDLHTQMTLLDGLVTAANDIADEHKVAHRVIHHQELLNQQQHLIDMISQLFAHKKLKQGTGVREMQAYLDKHPAASAIDKLNQCKSIATGRIKTDAEHSPRTFKRRTPELVNFYNVVTQMKFVTLTDIQSTQTLLAPLTREMYLASPTASPAASPPPSPRSPFSGK